MRRVSVLAPDLCYHLATGFAQRLEKRIVEFSDFDVLVLAELLQEFCIVSVELGQRKGVFGLCHPVVITLRSSAGRLSQSDLLIPIVTPVSGS